MKKTLTTIGLWIIALLALVMCYKLALLSDAKSSSMTGFVTLIGSLLTGIGGVVLLIVLVTQLIDTITEDK